MALVSMRSDVSLDTHNMQTTSQIAGGEAGEDITNGGMPCYIKASDGKVYMSNGTAANEAARVHGFSAAPARAGQGVTLHGPGNRAGYALSGLTPGAPYFLAATAGRLDTAATTGGTAPIAFAINSTDVEFVALSIA